MWSVWLAMRGATLQQMSDSEELQCPNVKLTTLNVRPTVCKFFTPYETTTLCLCLNRHSWTLVVSTEIGNDCSLTAVHKVRWTTLVIGQWGTRVVDKGWGATVDIWWLFLFVFFSSCVMDMNTNQIQCSCISHLFIATKIFYVQALLLCVLYTAMNQRGTTGDSAKTYLVLPPDHIDKKSSECTMSDLSTILWLLLGTQCVGSVGVAVLIWADSVFRFLGVFF